MSDTHFSTAIHDDDMEISSDIDHRPGMDEDIDIDLDLTDGKADDQDDDYIIRDASLDPSGVEMESTTAMNDDIMLDEENVMQEDGNGQDEEIFDVADTTEHVAVEGFAFSHELQEAPQIHQHVISADRTASQISPEPNHLDNSEQPKSNDLGVTDQENHIQPDAAAPNEHEPEPKKEVSEPAQENLSRTTDERSLSSEGEGTDDKQEDATQDQEVGHNKENHVPKQSSQLLASDRTEEQVEEQHGGAYTESIIHYHPVVLVYQGSEMSLFPPTVEETADTFLLEDHELVHQSFEELLKACRSVLADSISEEDELEMHIEDLGLSLNEDSIHSKNTSLYRILEVYIQLLQHDGVEHPDPLYMTLSTKVRFSKRLDDLIHAVSEGKGMSQLPYWTALTGEEDFAEDGDEEPEGERGNAPDTHLVSEVASQGTDVIRSEDTEQPLSAETSTLAAGLEADKDNESDLRRSPKSPAVEELNFEAPPDTSASSRPPNDLATATGDASGSLLAHDSNGQGTTHDGDLVEEISPNEHVGQPLPGVQNHDLPEEARVSSGSSTLQADEGENSHGIDSDSQSGDADSLNPFPESTAEDHAVSNKDSLHVSTESAQPANPSLTNDSEKELDTGPQNEQNIPNVVGQDQDDAEHGEKLAHNYPQSPLPEISIVDGQGEKDVANFLPGDELVYPDDAKFDQENDENWNIDITDPVREMSPPGDSDHSARRTSLGSEADQNQGEQTNGDLYTENEENDDPALGLGHIADTTGTEQTIDNIVESRRVDDDRRTINVTIQEQASEEDEINYEDDEDEDQANVDADGSLNGESDPLHVEVETTAMKRGRVVDEDEEADEDGSQGDPKRFRSASRE